jgi:pyrimidine deaminase RibD-like protein
MVPRRKSKAAQDLEFIKMAIEEAKKCPSDPENKNPRVGAVAVKNGVVVAVAHRGEKAAGDHAEYTALEKKLQNGELTGATIYTTLEPCTARHHPKIPCAQRIVERKVARVVIGMLDPNEKICGRGVWHLRESGIATDLFANKEMKAVEELNREFIRLHRPSSIVAASAPGKGDLAIPEPQVAEEDKEMAAILRMLDCAEKRDFGAAHSAFLELQSLTEDGEQKERQNLYYLQLKARYAQDAEARAGLLKAAGPSGVGILATQLIASLDKNSGNIKAATTRLEEAMNLAGSPDAKAELALSAAHAWSEVDDNASATEVLRLACSLDLSPSVSARVWKALADATTGDGRPIQRAAFLCKAASVNPTSSTHFDAAYALGGAKLSALSAVHYELALHVSPDADGSKNNLGVAFNNLGLASMGVEAHRAAGKNGHTLAMANLAQKFIEAGLFPEAEAEIKRGMAHTDPHVNVAHAMVDLSRAREAEEEKWKAERKTALRQKHTFTELAEALVRPTNADGIAGAWHVGSSVVATLTIVAAAAQAAWEDPSGKSRFRGEIVGQTLVGSLEKWQQYYDKWELKGTLSMALSEDGTLSGILLDPDGKLRTIEWKRPLPIPAKLET